MNREEAEINNLPLFFVVYRSPKIILTNIHKNQKMIVIPSQQIIRLMMNDLIRYYLITALFNHLFMNLKNRDGFAAFPRVSC